MLFKNVLCGLKKMSETKFKNLSQNLRQKNYCFKVKNATGKIIKNENFGQMQKF